MGRGPRLAILPSAAGRRTLVALALNSSLRWGTSLGKVSYVDAQKLGIVVAVVRVWEDREEILALLCVTTFQVLEECYHVSPPLTDVKCHVYPPHCPLMSVCSAILIKRPKKSGKFSSLLITFACGGIVSCLLVLFLGRSLC